MADDDEIQIEILRYWETLPQPPKTAAQRKATERRRWGPGGKQGFEAGARFGGHFAWAERYTFLSIIFGPEMADRLAREAGVFRAWDALHEIWTELDQWFEATGERVEYLRPVERLGLQPWLWERARRRHPDRFKPNKSRDHDAPWQRVICALGCEVGGPHGAHRVAYFDYGDHFAAPAPSHDAPPRWAPRRWFRQDALKALRKLFPGLPLHPLQVSVSRALNQERAELRAMLATETSSGQWREEQDGWWTDAGSASIAERNHPKPQGFWNVKWNGAEQRLDWTDRKWEPCDDNAPPESVLARTHAPPAFCEPTWLLAEPRSRLYWKRVKDRPSRKWHAWSGPRTRTRMWADGFETDDLDRLTISAAFEAAG